MLFTQPINPKQYVVGYKKESRKTLQTTGTQVSLHFNGALCLDGMKTLRGEYKTIDADSMVDFLRKLESSTSAKKIYLIMDNARANKNQKVEALYLGINH
jgi:hypothetical protein